MENQKILIVDDSEMNRALLVEMLKEQYDIEEAADGEEAIRILQQRALEFSMILLDIIMPKADGFVVLAYMNQYHLLDSMAVIMISADDSNQYIKKAYDMGAFDYISRPFDTTVVLHRVSNTMLLYTKQHRLENIVAEQIYEQQKNNKLMISILSHIVEFRNGESGRHVANVGSITELLLKQLVRSTDQYPLSSEDIDLISTASALHDIGKISISDAILNKPGRLTAEEFTVMKQHASIGADMLRDLPAEDQEVALVKTAYEICRWHHERYDGSGYPDGLQGDEIPISAQVVSIADVYDALTSERCYKNAYSHEEAIQMILRGQCGVFNPVLLDCLKAVGNMIGTVLNTPLSHQYELQTIQTVRDKLHRYDLSHPIQNMGFLDLLHFEHQQLEFFSEISTDILFSYNCETDILRFNFYGAQKLGLEATIVSPKSNRKFQKVLQVQTLESFIEQAYQAKPEKPLLQLDLVLLINGEEKRYHCFCKTIWNSSAHEKPVGLVGSLSVVAQKPIPNTNELVSQSFCLTADKLPYSFSTHEALEIIHYLQLAFDKVHVVDASGEQHGILNEDGIFVPTAEHCLTMWNKNYQCERCISAKVLASKGRASKLQFMDSDVFHILAVYIEIDGTPYSLVMVTRLTDETLLEESGRERLIASIRDYNEKLYMDPLTKTYNRRYYEEYLRAAEREQAIAVIDVDNFKYINDHYGHQAGDMALRSIAKVISGCIRKNDDVIRYGGDEFVLVFGECSAFRKILEEIRLSVDSLTLDLYPDLKLSVSVGCVYGTGKIMELFQIADSIMYHSKTIKNAVTVYSLEEWKKERKK